MRDPKVVAELVARCAAGDRSAFRVLFDGHVGLVRRVARELGEREGDELVQETFVRAWSHLESLKAPALFGAWVSTIARRVAYARTRGQKVTDEALGRFAAELDETAVPPESEDVALVVVRELLDGLEAGPERDTVTGFYLDGKTVADLMVEQAAAKGTITARLSRFRARVKRRLAARLVAAGETHLKLGSE
ncbi:MAG: RNA polymerase sigma factor [Myxococcaceae bacterium]|nr:RNA polymerase sigma factor [Myxococcaceae bacterium]